MPAAIRAVTSRLQILTSDVYLLVLADPRSKGKDWNFPSVFLRQRPSIYFEMQFGSQQSLLHLKLEAGDTTDEQSCVLSTDGTVGSQWMLLSAANVFADFGKVSIQQDDEDLQPFSIRTQGFDSFWPRLISDIAQIPV